MELSRIKYRIENVGRIFKLIYLDNIYYWIGNYDKYLKY